jgi:predicted MFS family arabinose efflux permease
VSKEDRKDPFDGEYIGNIWGWKTSLWGLALILFFVGLILYRSYTTGKPIFPDAPPAAEQPLDSEALPPETD